MLNCIRIVLRKNELVIRINEQADHKSILEELKKKLPELKKLYKEDDTPIYVEGKILKNKEMEDIQKVIQSVIKVEIDFESPKELGLYGIKKSYEREIKTSETKFYKGSVRSGQKIEFEGSIAVLGDVNGGAEVIAGDNIVVLGALRGLAHAGAKGNKKAIISANIIDSPQIRIADMVREREEGELFEKSYAFIEEKDIKIDKV